MDLSVDNIVVAIAFLTSISATFNAVLLRGGRLAWSQVFIVLAMISFMLSVILERYLTEPVVQNFSLGGIFFVFGFGLLLLASLKLHSSLK